jgi:hypothetical protein
MTKQLEALRIAEQLKDLSNKFPTPSHDRGVVNSAIDELRRLHEEVEVLMNVISKAFGDDEETVLRAINAQRPDYDGDDEAYPNHRCNGRIVHLPSGEECSACGKATGETE